MFPTVTMCTQLRTLRTGSYAPNRRRRRRSLFTNFSKPIPAHVNIQVQYYTKQNVTRGIHTTYITGKSKNIYGHTMQQELMNIMITIRLFDKYMLRG